MLTFSVKLININFVAHELRAWLLHYSPLVLHGLIHEDYYQHHLLLVEAIYLLLQDVVNTVDITQSSLLLKKYCFLFSTLYGKHALCAIIIHDLYPEKLNNHLQCMCFICRNASYVRKCAFTIAST